MLESSGSPYQTYSQAIVRQPPSQAVYYQQPNYQLAPRPSVWDTYRQMLAPRSEPTGPVESAVTGLRHVGEGAAIAALLAFAQRQFGTLDVRGKYPVDGILGAVLLALSVKESGQPNGYSGDLRALSQACTVVFTYRKVLGDGGSSAAGASERKSSVAKDSSIPRNTSDDPIKAAALAAGL
jgi:hypothetical protein